MCAIPFNVLVMSKSNKVRRLANGLIYASLNCTILDILSYLGVIAHIIFTTNIVHQLSIFGADITMIGTVIQCFMGIVVVALHSMCLIQLWCTKTSQSAYLPQVSLNYSDIEWETWNFGTRFLWRSFLVRTQRRIILLWRLLVWSALWKARTPLPDIPRLMQAIKMYSGTVPKPKFLLL